MATMSMDPRVGYRLAARLVRLPGSAGFGRWRSPWVLAPYCRAWSGWAGVVRGLSASFIGRPSGVAGGSGRCGRDRRIVIVACCF